MIGIKAIASYVPTSRIDNIEQGKRFGESESFIREKIGARWITRKRTNEETSDLALQALQSLLKKSGLSKDSIDALVVITQNGDGAGLPHTSAILQAKAGIPSSVAAFDVSLGCSGYVYGISIVKGFLETSGFKNALLVTADPYSKVISPDDRVTALLFGDAATATWIGEQGNWSIGIPLFGTDGRGAEHLVVRNKILSMNGRQIFDFAATTIPRAIKNYLATAQVDPNDVDLFCLHQGSAAIIDTIARRFPDIRERFAVQLNDTGNTISSSIPLILEQTIDDPAINRILLCGFGVGLSWATTLLERI